MKRDEFRRLAERMFEDIPGEYRAGVRSLVVEPGVEPHPEIEGMYTLGECVTEEWPSPYGGAGDLASDLILHYGSFDALGRQEPDFDWEAELWETILHELLHHREAAAGTASLELFDWLVEQNARRHVGLPFSPDFVRLVPADERGVRRLESDLFVEGEVPVDDSVEGGHGPDDAADVADPADAEGAADGGSATEVSFRWRGGRYVIPAPGSGAWTYVRATNLAGGRLWVVVRHDPSLWRKVLGKAEEATRAEGRARRIGAEPEASDAAPAGSRRHPGLSR